MMRQRRRSIDEIPASTRSRGETLKRLYGYISGFWRLRVVVLLIVLTTVLDVLSPAIIGSIIDMVKAIATGETAAPGAGIEGFAISNRDEVVPGIRRLLASNGPCLMHVLIDPVENVWPLVPAGKSNSEMMERKP